MVFRDALWSRFQFVFTSKDIPFFSVWMGLGFSEKFDKVRGRDDIPERARVSLNIRPNCCKFVALRAPTSSGYEAPVARLDYQVASR
jgi:hypothetical protein